MPGGGPRRATGPGRQQTTCGATPTPAVLRGGPEHGALGERATPPWATPPGPAQTTPAGRAPPPSPEASRGRLPAPACQWTTCGFTLKLA
eukprot:9624338-Alexandrium_andersonii.AAC.1